MEILRASDAGQEHQLESSPDGHLQRGSARLSAKKSVATDFSDAARGGTTRANALPTITALKPALRDAHRVNIFVDGKFSFSLDLAQVADYKLKVGQTLSPEQLEELQHASAFGKLYQRTLEYTFSRPHSVQEVRDHLRRKQRARQMQARRYADFQAKLQQDPDFKEQVRAQQARTRERHQAQKGHSPLYTVDADGGYTFRATPGTSYEANNENEYGAQSARRYPTKPADPISDRDIERVIAQLLDKGYLDDYRFTEYFVENRHLKKGISTKKLRLELRQKGVADHIIDQVLAANPRDQLQEIRKMILKKRRRGYDDQKLIQYLLRQGFDYGLVQDALHETD